MRGIAKTPSKRPCNQYGRHIIRNDPRDPTQRRNSEKYALRSGNGCPQPNVTFIKAVSTNTRELKGATERETDGKRDCIITGEAVAMRVVKKFQTTVM